MEELPQAIERYFSSKNSGDFAGATSAFSDGAVVVDEGRTYVTKEAIHAWVQETGRKYNDKSEIEAVEQDGDATRVTAQVTGTFPGSPVTLKFTFVIDRGLIDRLEIGT